MTTFNLIISCKVGKTKSAKVGTSSDFVDRVLNEERSTTYDFRSNCRESTLYRAFEVARDLSESSRAKKLEVSYLFQTIQYTYDEDGNRAGYVPIEIGEAKALNISKFILESCGKANRVTSEGVEFINSLPTIAMLSVVLHILRTEIDYFSSEEKSYSQIIARLEKRAFREESELSAENQLKMSYYCWLLKAAPEKLKGERGMSYRSQRGLSGVSSAVNHFGLMELPEFEVWAKRNKGYLKKRKEFLNLAMQKRLEGVIK